MDDYEKSYITSVLENLMNNYQVDSTELRSIKKKFIQSMNEDSNFIFHFSSEYWARFIAESAGLSVKNSLQKIY